MMGFLYIILWAVLFFICYVCMAWRETVCSIHYDSIDFKPKLFVSLFVPPIGIVFALAEVAIYKMGLKEKGAHAV